MEITIYQNEKELFNKTYKNLIKKANNHELKLIKNQCNNIDIYKDKSEYFIYKLEYNLFDELQKITIINN